jgi:polyribonucleotide nucleotidyltransferase
MLHYNFPPYSVGEVKPMRGPGRREIGHGALAERALARLMPSQDSSRTPSASCRRSLESNGSSSMATVCGGTLAMMDAGVPIKAPVAGVAMGLIMEGDKYAVLTDILGDEDHLGDMDFKVCGTARASPPSRWTSRSRASPAHPRAGPRQASDGACTSSARCSPGAPRARAELSKYAPRITSLKVKPDQIRLVIGPGGKTIKGIVDQTGVAIDVEDDGTVNIASATPSPCKRAIDIIRGLTAEPEIGAVYKGTVKRIVDFGAFVEILPGTDGLVHIEDGTGKIRLSRRAVLPLPEGEEGDRARERMERSHAEAPRRPDGPGRGPRPDRPRR